MNDLDSGAYELTPITDNAAFLTFDKQEVVPVEIAREMERQLNWHKNEVKEYEEANAADHISIEMRNGSRIVGLINNEIHLRGYRLDTIFFLDEGPIPDWLRPASEQVIQIKSEKESLAEIAKETWQTTYPERRKWEELGEDTQAEWARFCENCIAAYLKYEK